jgi:hypothetical protein
MNEARIKSKVEGGLINDVSIEVRSKRGKRLNG